MDADDPVRGSNHKKKVELGSISFHCISLTFGFSLSCILSLSLYALLFSSSLLLPFHDK